jgi:hypothetical protein
MAWKARSEYEAYEAPQDQADDELLTTSSGFKGRAILLGAGVFLSEGGVRCVMTEVSGFLWVAGCGWRR